MSEHLSSEPLLEDIVFSELTELFQTQGRPEADLELIKKAFDYGRKMHDGQKRKNGDNYISHPVSVAVILAKIPLDTNSVVAAILHDTIEDTPAKPEEIKSLFGQDVLNMVESVTKLGKYEFSSKEDAQAENFRRMFLAMAEDIRVIMLKLADRLHNMRTLEHMKPEKQLKKAGETIEIFAPLANRMGMGKIRAELEDLSLKYLDPEQYGVIDAEISETKDEWEKTIELVSEKIKSQMRWSENHQDAPPVIYGRVKNYYSIYKKMQTRQKTVSEIFDLSAIRVLVNNEKECYEVLGIVHSAFTPIPGRFKDYIAMPKSNLYQSLHTTVIGPYGRPLEVQIRTHEMHRIAEYGIAAHWHYKEAGSSKQLKENIENQKMTWLRQMVEIKDDTGDARDYVDSVKLDLFSDEVFVFTPKGKVVVLPKDSTPIDFAYRIHTEVGNTCIGSMVNGKIVTLDYTLKNGDIVEINTNKKSSPRLDWINFVQTTQAKNRIRLFFKKHFKEEHEAQGRTLLEAELTKAGLDEMIKNGKLLEAAKTLNFTDIDDLLASIGYGEMSVTRVMQKLRAEEYKAQIQDLRIQQFTAPRPTNKKSGSADDIIGLEGMLYHLAKCCNPLPGESITGIVTRSRGVMVHREDCVNLLTANENRLMMLSWSAGTEATNSKTAKTHAVKLDIHVIDRVGVLKDILGRVADTKTNLSNTKIRMHPDQTATIEITVDIQNLQHLERVKNAILQVPDVISVTRQQAKAGQADK